MKSQRELMHENIREWAKNLELILGLDFSSEKLTSRIKKIKDYVEYSKKQKAPEIVVPNIPIEDSQIYNAIRTLAKAIGVDEGVNAKAEMQIGNTKDLELTKEYTTLYPLTSTIRIYAQDYALNKEASARETRKTKDEPNS